MSLTPRQSAIPPADPPSDVLAAARTDAARTPTEERPAWLDRFVWSVLGKILAAAAFAALAVYAFDQLGHLLGILAISLFFALAMIPGVEALVRRFGMRRGAAVGIIYLAALVAVDLNR